MLLSIIIISYNTKDLTLQAIKSVLADIKSSKLLKNKTEIIVVDNNSSDGSAEAVKDLLKILKQCEVITNKDNLGFAKANNQAIKLSTGKYIFLLNSDTIVQKGSLEALVKTFEEHPVNEKTAQLKSHYGELDRIGILAPALVNQDGSPQPHGGDLPNLLTLSTQMLFLDDIPILGKLIPSIQHTGKRAQLNTKTKLYPQGWVGGAAMMIKREVIDEIGLLDEGVFMYAEDTEYCLRAQNHHWDIAINPNSKITHIGSASSSASNAIIGEFSGYVSLWKKHKPSWQLPFTKTILKTGALLRILVFGIILRDTKKSKTYRKILYSNKL